LRVGIFGQEGAGKSTLFRALAGGGDAAGSPGRQKGVCTIKVPDIRLDRLASHFRPKKVTPVSITFVEIDPGEGTLLPPETLAAIRTVEALSVVLRGFEDDFHPAPAGGLAPLAELEAIESELVVADYLVAQKRIERMTKEARRDAEWSALRRVVRSLEDQLPVRRLSLSPEESRVLAGFRFVSRIPLILVLNVGEEALAAEPFTELGPAASSKGIPLVRLSARIEEEIAQLSAPEQAEFHRELGMARGAREQLVRAVLDAMDCLCFFTVGEEEVKAWTLRRGTTALAAAGKIHSDMEKGFIRAEVIDSEEYLRCGSMANAKTEGKLRVEGKEYVVRDGEIVHVRFHV
jgi:ribosome-binding ATPase